MTNENSKKGLVGFFDILGYQNLLERNEPETIAEEVLPILTELDSAISKQLIELFKSHKNKDNVESIIAEMGWLIFSDTILVTLPFDQEEESDDSGMRWLIFLLAAISIQCKLFRAGLPARGAISFGKFFVKDNCFAGRTIIEAYRLCNEIEMSACVLCESAADTFQRHTQLNKKSDFTSFVVEYLVPMKGREQHSLALMAHSYDHQIQKAEIHAEVMRSFWGNRKDIPLNVRSKVSNTEQWLEFINIKRQLKQK